MFGNGAAIGTVIIIMLTRHKTTLKALLRVVRVFCAAARGTTTTTASALPTATTTIRAPATTPSVSGAPGLFKFFNFTILPFAVFSFFFFLFSFFFFLFSFFFFSFFLFFSNERLRSKKFLEKCEFYFAGECTCNILYFVAHSCGIVIANKTSV